MITQSESGLTQTQYENVQAATDDLSIQVQLQRYGPVWAAHEDAGAYYQRVMALNPLAYWPLGGIYGRHDKDLVGDYDMTAVNTPSWIAHPTKLWYPNSGTILTAPPVTGNPWWYYRHASLGAA